MEILDAVTSSIPSNSGAWKASTILLLLFVAAIAWPVMIKYWNMRNKHDEILNDFESVKDSVNEVKEIVTSIIAIQRNREQIYIDLKENLEKLMEVVNDVMKKHSDSYESLYQKIDSLNDMSNDDLNRLMSEIHENTLTTLTVTYTLISKLDDMKRLLQQKVVDSGSKNDNSDIDINFIEKSYNDVKEKYAEIINVLTSNIKTIENNLGVKIDSSEKNVIGNNNQKIKEFVDEMYYRIKDISREIKNDNIKEIEEMLNKFKMEFDKFYEK